MQPVSCVTRELLLEDLDPDQAWDAVVDMENWLAEEAELELEPGAEGRFRLDEIFAEHSGQSKEQVHEDMERDRFFTPSEAVQYGLIDSVIASRNANADANGNGNGNGHG